MAIADKLTTREALRRATLDDVVSRCEIAAVTQEGGPLDGLKVLSMGILRDQVSAHLMVDLGPPVDTTAEVTTPATIITSAVCPECHLPVEITVHLHPRLTVENGKTEISIKGSSKARAHLHGQMSLPEAEGQVGMDDVVIDDLRLRILRGIYDLQTDYGAAEDRGDVPTPISLDAIADQLEVAGESDRGDLEESLYAYSQLEAPLVTVFSEKDAPVTYGITQAGMDLVDAADEDGADPDAVDVDPSDPDDPGTGT